LFWSNFSDGSRIFQFFGRFYFLQEVFSSYENALTGCDGALANMLGSSTDHEGAFSNVQDACKS